MKNKSRSEKPDRKPEFVRLPNGGINILVFDTAKELTKYLIEFDPERYGHFEGKTIYGEYYPDPNYISYGTLALSKESSPGLIAHEVYHAIRHISRVTNPGLFSDRNGAISPREARREEREADMFGQTINIIWEKVMGKKP